jgi:hypothetical protein
MVIRTVSIGILLCLPISRRIKIMRTKIPTLFLALLLSAPAFAQQPRIDSIAVDEDRGELLLLGNFLVSLSSEIIVDSISLSITGISNTEARARIPVQGKGSCGSVSIIQNGKESNRRLLTYFHYQVFHYNFLWHSLGYNEFSQNEDKIHIRLDLESFKKSDSYTIVCSRLSSCHDQARGSNAVIGNDSIVEKYNGPTYDSSGIFRHEITYYPLRKIFSYDINFFGGGGFIDSYVNDTLDINFQPTSGIQSTSFDGLGCGQGEGVCLRWSPIAPTDFPPSSATVYEQPSTPNILPAHLSSDPVVTNAEVIITLQNSMSVRMEIMDILGHIVLSEERMLSAGENRLPLNSSHFTPGIYICRLQAGGEVVSVRFVKE